MAFSFQYIALAALVLASVVGFGQGGQPNQLPEDFTADPTDEVYMQNGAAGARRQTFETMRSYFAGRIVELQSTPTQTGNSKRNVIGADPGGDIWFIDYLGNALTVERDWSGGYWAIQEARYNGSTILITVPIPNDQKLLQISRDGFEIRQQAGDFTITGNTLNLTIAANQDYFIIRSPL